MGVKSAILLFGFLAIVSGDWQDILPWQVKTTLLELSDQFQIYSVRGTPKPIYRHDLPVNYIAYWYIPINKNEYVILSSSPKTGDYKLVIQGRSPSLLEELESLAKIRNDTCDQYFMLTPTPDVQVSCQTGKGYTVLSQSTVNFDEEDFRTLDKLWKEQRNDVIRENIWEQSILSKHQDAIYYHVIGDKHKIVVGDSKHMRIKTMNGGDVTNMNDQEELCKLLKVCHPHDKTLLDPSKFAKTKYGQIYVHVKVPHSEKDKDVHYFEVTGEDRGEAFSSRFMLDPHPRSKRASSWTQYSINDESYFPDYNQLERVCHVKKGWWWGKDKNVCCSVGCGPVAWAMVLGYYDRRSHDKQTTYGTGSQSLFNCGSDATSGGSSCVAPSYTSDQVKLLTKYLHHLMGTFCLKGQGATKQGDMKKFDRYFNSQHQKSGNPSVHVHTNGLWSFVGGYSDYIRNYALGYIREKWPVVVGIRVSGVFSQHYPVATRYRTRSKRVCTKFLWWKSCKTVQEYEMYTHMGWGGRHDGWRSAKMFMAGVAKY